MNGGKQEQQDVFYLFEGVMNPSGGLGLGIFFKDSKLAELVDMGTFA